MSDHVYYIGKFKLESGRCRIYKLNILDCMTDREREWYNCYTRGFSHTKMQKFLNKEINNGEKIKSKDAYSIEDIIKKFPVSLDVAKEMYENNYPKEIFRNLLLSEIEGYPEELIRSIDKRFLYMSYQENEDTEYVVTDTENISRQVVWFENECVRRCRNDLENTPLIKEIIVLKCRSNLMTGILEQIIDRGVDVDGKHYIFFTSSTSQMKNAEITLLEEFYWEKNKDALMCGLSEEVINESGGINMSKFFAAKALSISNSVKYDTGIDIDEVLIVPDFETMVTGMVNYLDVNTLDIEQKKMVIPIQHMDGAGIFIPGTSPCSCQIRGGWIKGAIFPFDFHRFIRKYRHKISDKHLTDAWGNPVTIEEFLNAKLILTDSQLKMRKYYKSMDEYRQHFRNTNQSITINNYSHSPEKDSQVSVAYQPFQTIPRENITEDNIKGLTQKTIEYINKARTEPKYALKLMGMEIDEEQQQDREFDALHASLQKYPELLEDVHVRKVMQRAAESARKKAMGCKLFMEGLWSYICPDLYAFCQWLFLGEENPEGLLKDGYIYNRYYVNTDVKESCCLRYPHLSDCEHAIRKVDKSDECQRWFRGYDTVVSCHDLISKVLQADWDGDHICLVHDKEFLNVLDRNKYPLYYEMTKAEPSLIDNEHTMTCLTSSFNNENIGYVSNAITKIFNSDNPDTKLVKVLCAYNNFVIDYFKTQKKMDLKNYEIDYARYKDKESKCPYFFRYAKNKKQSSCLSYNPSCTADRISKYVMNETKGAITYTVENLQFNPENLKNKSIKVNRNSDKYQKLRDLLLKLKGERKNLYKKLSTRVQEQNSSLNLDITFSSEQLFDIHCISEIRKIIEDKVSAVNYLVDIEYYTPENMEDRKDIIWNCYGDVIYQNICDSIDNNVEVKTKRNLYESYEDKIKDIENLREQVMEEMKQTQVVDISESLYNKIMNVNTRKNGLNDKYLLFIIYVLIQRHKKKYNIDGEDYIHIYKNSKSNKLTRKTIDDWIGSQCTKSGLKRLWNKGYIRMEFGEKYDKVYFEMKIPEDDSVKFTVENAHPLVDLFRNNEKKKTAQCLICHKWFIVKGNTKTCSLGCSRKLEKINKNNNTKLCGINNSEI